MCVGVVPLLHRGPIELDTVEDVMEKLWYDRQLQSIEPEGIVIYFPSLDTMRKVTFEGNKHKGELVCQK
jgi:hypothetical protein